ncbi:MAG TPA: glucoamylase family protein [Flavisolibacter sp.]|nr:glucoamylase family protein [Flavisolibacter sp.]
MRNTLLILGFVLMISACKKNTASDPAPTPAPPSFSLMALRVNGAYNGFTYYNVNFTPTIRISFSTKIKQSSIANAVTLQSSSGSTVALNASLDNSDSTIVIQPASALSPLTQYNLTVGTMLTSVEDGRLQSSLAVKLITQIDTSDKFPRIPDNQLLDLVQQQTFKYFWDFAHPVSGLARERNTSGDLVTSGGSGFGIMAIITGIHRNFITKQQGLARMQTIVSFLKNTAQRFHGAYPHWLNGNTGAVIPFSTKDNGADLVETSYLIQGLLCARQYFNGADPLEAGLRNDINSICNAVEWSWFRKNGENVLYWHWSPNYNWEMNLPIRGWNECLITYVLAASSTSFGIPRSVYDNGWARNGGMVSNSTHYGINLPLGPPFGGPLFFSHYSFLGINPNDLTDAYANYETQVVNHTRINHEYCKANPQGHFGYSDECWGLTASDVPNGYAASSPGNDIGVIAPTAALSSFPYTPEASMKALKFFYYKLGNKLWGPYGFYDAFSLKDTWFANSYLAIDQGPIIVMIENYRSGLLWDLFMSCPEVKTGMLGLGFQSPYL